MRKRRAWWTLPVLLLSVAPATAQPPGKADAALQPTPVPGVSSTLPPAEVHTTRRTFALSRRGVEMHRRVELGERTLELGVKGPLLKRKRFGVAFEVRF